jgi:Putative beta-barrel porin-2, OmpL-like. bbp2
MHRKNPSPVGAGLAAALLAAAAPAPLLAQTSDGSTKPAAQAAKGPTAWADTLKIGGYLQSGLTFNPDDPPDRKVSFGRLFDDRANQPLLNQLAITAERPIDPKLGSFDFGFKFHGFYGSDARYTHFLGEFDRTIEDTNQFDIVEANLQAHLPIADGISTDVKVGQFVTLLGAETIDPRTNYFYSHSYIFNFGVPLKHTGVMTTTHLPGDLDVYLGYDTGVNTWIGKDHGDNNGVGAFQGGIGASFLDGSLTVLATTHIGPELPTRVFGAAANDHYRFLNDVVVTWKPNDVLTLITDANYIRDNFFHADGYGVAQYAIYKLSDQLSVAARGEVWRDQDNFFVAQFVGNRDFVNLERGIPPEDPRSGLTGGRTTYGALTLGLNYKPAGLPATFDGFVVRPELRYDRALNGNRPFDGFTSLDQFTIGIDFILPFSIL